MSPAPAAAILAHLEACGLHLRAVDGNLVAKPKEALTEELRALIRAHKPELLQALADATAGAGELPDPSPEEIRKALAQIFLETHPNVRRACFVDVLSDPAHIVLTIALREPWAVAEMMVERARFNSFDLMELSLRHPDTSITLEH